jgi:Zn ribbon nucleic-acid-binding protein
MAMNRVQIQPGLSMFEFLQRYGTEEQCEAALAGARWPDGYSCPRCKGSASYAFRRGRQPYRECVGCGYQCSLIAGTIFEATKLPLTRWFMAMQLLTQSKNNVSALELMRQLGISYPSAWLMKQKIMQAMLERESLRQLSGRVEIDDAYLGGQRTGGKAGRGSENKVPFVIAVQTADGGQPDKVCMAQLPFRRQAIAEFAARRLVRPLTVVSDGLGCFKVLAEAGVHVRMVTGGGTASAKLPQFHAVNTVLGNLKTAIAGTYHGFKFAKYAARYLAEFQYRFNRRYRMHEILPRLVRAMVLSTPCNTAFIRAPEVPC